MLDGRSVRRLLGLGLLGALAGACGPPSRPPLPRSALYAARPRLAGLDTSPLRGRRILIDPGHGGRFDGAQGVQHTREADVNLGVGLYLWGLLHDAGADVHLTRSSDRDLLPDSSKALRDDLAARVGQIDSLHPEIFLSLHHNSNAALDRERNDIETYYKLDDEGPSYDLARAIHRQLATHLGIPVAQILPGNYYVLRSSPTTAVLGEASYLSNPTVEQQLRLAEKQMLEAEAYFLGLLDYFERGVPRIEKLEPSGDTLQSGGTLRFRVVDERSVGIDPLSAVLSVDGARVAAPLDVRRELALPAGPDLAAGEHDVLVEARNVRGNAARPWSGRIILHRAPARLLVQQEPDPAAPGAEVRLRVRLQDLAGHGVGDGTPVRLEGLGLELLAAESATRGGDLLALARVAPGAKEARLQVQSEALRQESAVRVQAGAARTRFLRCVDATRTVALADVWARCAVNALERSDRAGLLRLAASCDTLRLERRGYSPWRGVPPADGELRLEPLFAGRLQDVVFVLDPAGGGQQPTAPGIGVSTADLDLDLCRMLGDLLQAGGARVALTRGPADPVADVERVRLAVREHASWYVRVESSFEPHAADAVLYYPGSAGGEAFAKSMALWLGRRFGSPPVAVRTDTRIILQQTPCPAVLVQLRAAPGASSAIDPDQARRRAYALFTGIRAALDPRFESRPTLVGHVESGSAPVRLVMLDGAEALPLDAGGGFRFEGVAPGKRLLSLQRGGSAIQEMEILVAGTDTTRVQIPPAAARP